MEQLISAFTNGLVSSSMYILVALGFALVLSIMGIFNFAHGAIYMVGGYVCYYFSEIAGLNQWVSLILSALVMGCFGIFLEKFCFRRFFGDANKIIIMAIALILILETTVNILLGGSTRSLPSFVPGVITVGTATVSAERVAAFAIGAGLLCCMTLLIRKTKIGQQMLAVAQEPEGAALVGISIHRVSAIACFIGCSLAAVAGALLGSILSLSPFMGNNMLVKAIELVIIAGIGSVGGLFFSGLIIGFIDTVLPLYMSAAMTDTIGLFVIILILLVRPRGIFGYELF